MLGGLGGDEIDGPLARESTGSIAGRMRLHIESGQPGGQVMFQTGKKIGGLHAEFYRRFELRANGVAGAFRLGGVRLAEGGDRFVHAGSK